MAETQTRSRATEFRPARLGTQRVRIDQGSACGSDLAPGRGSLLRAFGAWRSRPVQVQERRDERRFEAVECRAWVGWKTWRRFPLSSALVVNLSRGGAQIFLDTAPPSGKPVWVYLETPGNRTIVKARVVDVVATSSGQCSIRVAFHQPCPFAFFEAAVCGLAAIDPKVRVAKAPRALAAGMRA